MGEKEDIETKVKERIEEIISNQVNEQLEMKKKEIEKELLKKVHSARLSMEKEEKKEIAEERLAILAEQERIDKELRKQKKREEKKEKEEQMKILGKGNARPKLSFSLKAAPDGQL